MSEEHAELIKQLQIDLTIMDGPKIKSDITSLIKAGQTYMTKDEIARLTEDVKKIRIEIADNGYEVQNSKDLCLKLEKKIDSN